MGAGGGRRGGSPARGALAWAAREAARRGAELRVICAWSSPGGPHRPLRGPEPDRGKPKGRPRGGGLQGPGGALAPRARVDQCRAIAPRWLPGGRGPGHNQNHVLLRGPASAMTDQPQNEGHTNIGHSVVRPGAGEDPGAPRSAKSVLDLRGLDAVLFATEGRSLLAVSVELLERLRHPSRGRASSGGRTRSDGGDRQSSRRDDRPRRWSTRLSGLGCVPWRLRKNRRRGNELAGDHAVRLLCDDIPVRPAGAVVV